MSNDAIKSNQCPTGFVYIPEGTFKMGSENGDRDEQPVREVTIPQPLCVSKTEITNPQYASETVPAEPTVLVESEAQSTFQLIERDCCGNEKILQSNLPKAPYSFDPVLVKPATANDLCGVAQQVREVQPQPKVVQRDDKHPSPEGFDGPNQPAVRVSYDGASNYCKGIGGRLLTEAEWEYVARGENHNHAMDTGDINHSNAVFSQKTTADVCSKAGNYVVWGGEEVCDMNGNVWEWTQDTYGPYDDLGNTDPVNTAEGDRKVIRGGSLYSNNPQYLRSADRDFSWAGNRYNYVGFRCAVPPQDFPPEAGKKK